LAPMINLHESSKVVNDLNAIVKIAAADISMSRKMVEKNQKQFWRRTFVRSLFAGIEGINHRMKHISMLLANIHKIELTHAEIAMLREETYSLNEKGDATSSKSKLRTKENLCFTLKTFARVCNSPYEVDRNSEEWGSFNEALRIRDRLTHPKSSDDLMISDTELKTVQKTFKWYFACIIDILNISQSSLEALLEKDAKEKAKKKQSNESLKRDVAKSRRAP